MILDSESEISDLNFIGGPVPVVLVGHSIQNDLRAFRLDHWPLIDTSLIYSYDGLPECTPSLQDLALLLLRVRMRGAEDPVDNSSSSKGNKVQNDDGCKGHGKKGNKNLQSKQAKGSKTTNPAVAVPSIHDPSEDARISMRLIQLELQKAGFGLPLAPPQWRLPSEDLSRLLVYGIPASVQEEQLQDLLAKHKAPLYDHIEITGGGGGAGRGGNSGFKRAVMEFSHPGLANEAFTKLGSTNTKKGGQGEEEERAVGVIINEGKDCLGRAFKEIRLNTTSDGENVTIKIRKPACHNGLAFGKVDSPPLKYQFQSPYLAAALEAQKARAVAADTSAAVLTSSSRNQDKNNKDDNKDRKGKKGAGGGGGGGGGSISMGPTATYLAATRLNRRAKGSQI